MGIDSLAMAREDLLIAELRVVFETNATAKAELAARMNDVYPIYLGNFEKALNESPMKSGFVFGKKLTLADLIIFEGTQSLFQNNPSVLDNYPAIKLLRARVAGVDGISQYLAARKFYEY